MNINLFQWIREGVRHSVLLGVSDAVEQIGTHPTGDNLSGRLGEYLRGSTSDVPSRVAGSLADAVAIYRVAKATGTPVWSSSSLRYSSGAQAIRGGAVGKVLGADAYSPAPTEKTHPDLFWYGIHGVETLFTVMGPKCESVVRVNTPGMDVVTGRWSEGRIGTFRGIRAGKADYGGTAFGDQDIKQIGPFGGYRPLVVEIVKFFKSGEVPVTPEETLAIYAFMEGAEESTREGGKEIILADLLKRAEQTATQRLKELKVE
jgi:hypothetical protein